MMKELVVNLHIHSNYSDGSGTHEEIAKAAQQAGLDVVIVTDHNVLIQSVDRVYKNGDHTMLFMTGEEIHDRNRQPLKNHLLAIGHTTELSNFAKDPQLLIDKARQAGALTFIAHPYEDELQLIGEPDISWVDWQVEHYHGIEIWNHLSELKSVSPNWGKLLLNVFFPHLYSKGPNPKTLQKWDSLSHPNRKIMAIGGSDSHALIIKKSFFKKIVFPYIFHFQCINNHLLVPNELSGNLLSDRQMVLDALRQGHSFVGYDLPACTKGFRFTAQGNSQDAIMGDSIALDTSVTLQIRLPHRADCRLLWNGKVIKQWQSQEICSLTVNEAGVYRVECSIQYLGQSRGWIFSNPIYVINKDNL